MSRSPVELLILKNHDACNNSVGKFEDKRPLGDLGVDERIIFKRMFGKYGIRL